MSGEGSFVPSRRCFPVLLLTLSAVDPACQRVEDPVFSLVGLDLSPEPLRVAEDAGTISVPIRLARPAQHEIAVSYHAIGLTAQQDCQVPDFGAASGRLVWPAGESVATLQIWVQDDLLAETDERFQVVFDDAEGTSLGPTPALEIEIADNDRTDLIDAEADFGIVPNRDSDQSLALQAALGAAAQSGRGVVVLPEGDYDITSAFVQPGTTLSGRGAQLRRPAHAGPQVKTLQVEYSGDEDSAPTLIEGITIDGRREQQGAYRGYEQDSANLIEVAAAPTSAGRARIHLEDLSVRSGTGDGIYVGTNVDGNFCHLAGDDLWRDMLSLRGGNTRVRLRGLDATASAGKTGLWLDGGTPGYADSHRLDVELEDVRLETGDLEVDVSDASEISVNRLVMTEPPFRLVAVDSTVRVSDSVLITGFRASSQNYWGPFQDVQIKNSTLRVAESNETGTDPVASAVEEADRVLAPVPLQWPAAAEGQAVVANLLIEGCRFEQADDVEASDTLYAVSSRGVGPTIRIVSSTMTAAFEDWFAPGCLDCQVTP